MRIESELQYADFQPDQVEKVGKVDLDQGLKLITSYPWEREFGKIEERTKDNLTSTVPNITFRNKDREVLTVSARDKENFIIEFLTSTHRGELILPNNSIDNRRGFTTLDIVSNFYNGTVSSVIELKPIERIYSDETTSFRLREGPIVSLVVSAALATTILALDFWKNGFTVQALPAVYFVGAFVLAFGLRSIMIVQYTLTDWGKEISFGQNGELTIRQKGKEIRLMKGEIDHVVIVGYADQLRRRGYRYARIRTKDQRSFIVTTFIMEPIDLINRLKVNHKEEFALLATINYDIMSERQKERIRRFRERKKNEFLENFKEYDDSKLRQIVRDRQNYADYAVEAAMEILERRKNIGYQPRERV